ncbi:hypothetical protein [Natronosalvus vescus]|uniref:COG1470 family protein n=1 Tax=Natronosalvus vescus TaxID=2953881 RepID=UPI0020918D6D|nr:hypothetical protein [Natronosalvus vescus]
MNRFGTRASVFALVCVVVMLTVVGGGVDTGAVVGDEHGSNDDRIPASGVDHRDGQAWSAHSSHVLTHSDHDEAPDPADGEVADDGELETAYFLIRYHADYADEAETIAAVADDHYVVLHQKFGLELPEHRTQLIVGPRENQPCDAVGCVDPLNRVWVSTDSRSLLHHELVHTIQLREHWSPLNQLSDPDPGEGMFIEGTAKYLDASAAQIERSARFDPDAIDLTSYPEGSTEYAERALFVEFVIETYGREAFDALYLEGSVAGLEAATGASFADLRADFDVHLDAQQQRLRDGGAPLPAFTYDPIEPEPEQEVTLDARTPDAVAAIGRTWYPTEPDAFAWDLTGDGEVDATGPTATLEVPTTGEWPAEVTLLVEIDGETHAATQRIVLSGEPSIGVADAAVPDRLEPEETVSATVTVVNDDPRPTSDTLELVVGDERVASTTVELAPGEERTVELEGTVSGLEAGTYSLRITGSDEDAGLEGSIVLEDGGDSAADTDADVDGDLGDEDGSGVADSIPGFGVLMVLSALASVALAHRVLGWSLEGRGRSAGADD